MNRYQTIQLPKTAYDSFSDFYWNNRTACDCVLFLATCAVIARVLVAIA